MPAPVPASLGIVQRMLYAHGPLGDTVVSTNHGSAWSSSDVAAKLAEYLMRPLPEVFWRVSSRDEGFDHRPTTDRGR